MDAVHLHLILNHVPALGVVFAGLLLGTALWHRSPQFQRVALAMMVGSALVAVPVYLTGDGAEEAVEHIAGVADAAIDRHEDAAAASAVAIAILGGLALAGVVVFRRATGVPTVFAAGLLVLTLTTTGLFAWTGYLGGQIRHTELGGSVAAATDRRGDEDDD
jgi:uncharacterized membrane protein